MPTAIERRREGATGGRCRFAGVLTIVLAACGAAPSLARDTPRPSDTATIRVDAASPGARFAVEFLGNASRLDTLLNVRDADALRAMAGNPRLRPSTTFFAARYPHFRRFRVGNVFVGWQCIAKDFDELAELGTDGRLRFRFDQTLAMLQLVLDAGLKPHLALTGTPRALVPAGEQPLAHPTYGCVNAPAIDLTKPSVRDRVPEWWQLQDAFFAALVERFGRAEVQSWSFATWTEPWNPAGEPGKHLVLPRRIIDAGRHDEAVATLVAASIDAAMKHGLRIRLGNLAGQVEVTYPRLVAEVSRLPRGSAYLDHVDAYAISRYRTRPRADLRQLVDTGLRLLDDQRMPDRPLYIDEFGDLSGDHDAVSLPGLSGLAGGLATATVLQRAFARQDGSRRIVAGVAFWRDQVEPRARDLYTRVDLYMKTPSSHVIDMFAALDGHARLPVSGSALPAVAGVDDGVVRAVVVADGTQTAPARVVVAGLQPGARYVVTASSVDDVHGNPVAQFLRSAAQPALQVAGGRVRFASPEVERCYFDEEPRCAWRTRARDFEAPLQARLRVSANARGEVVVPDAVPALGVLSIVVQRADDERPPASPARR